MRHPLLTHRMLLAMALVTSSAMLSYGILTHGTTNDAKGQVAQEHESADEKLDDEDDVLIDSVASLNEGRRIVHLSSTWETDMTNPYNVLIYDSRILGSKAHAISLVTTHDSSMTAEAMAHDLYRQMAQGVPSVRLGTNDADGRLWHVVSMSDRSGVAFHDGDGDVVYKVGWHGFQFDSVMSLLSEYEHASGHSLG